MAASFYSYCQFFMEILNYSQLLSNWDSKFCYWDQSTWLDFFYHAERSGSSFGRFVAFLVTAVVVGAGLAGYIFYKYRLRVSLINSQLHIMYISFMLNLISKLAPYLINSISFCSLTWTRRSWLSCHSTCHWTSIIMKFKLKLNLYDNKALYNIRYSSLHLNNYFASFVIAWRTIFLFNHYLHSTDIIS